MKKGLRERPCTSSRGDLLAGGRPAPLRSRWAVAHAVPKRVRHEVRRDRSRVSPRRSTLDLTKNCREKLTFDLRGNPGFCRMACKTYFAAPAARKRARESPSPFPDLLGGNPVDGRPGVVSREPTNRGQCRRLTDGRSCIPRLRRDVSRLDSSCLAAKSPRAGHKGLGAKRHVVESNVLDRRMEP